MDPRYVNKRHTSNGSNPTALAPFIPSMMNQLSQLMQQQSNILYNQHLRSQELEMIQKEQSRRNNSNNSDATNNEELYEMSNNMFNYDTSKYLQLQSYLASILSNPYYPGWMVGPGGLPYLPPCVGKLYELQQEYFHKLAIKQQTQISKHLRKIELLQRKRQKQMEKYRKKKERMRKKEAKRLHKELKRKEKEAKRKEKERLKKEKKERKKVIIDGEEQFASSDDESDKDESDDNDDEKDIESDDSADEWEDIENEREDEDDDEEDEDDDDEPVELGKLPVYRLIILWSIAPMSKRDNDQDKDDFEVVRYVFVVLIDCLIV